MYGMDAIEKLFKLKIHAKINPNGERVLRESKFIALIKVIIVKNNENSMMGK